MSHFSMISISLLAVLPAIALGFFIYIKDRGDKEPLSLLALLIGVGAAAFWPVYFIRGLVVNGIDAMFADKMEFSLSGLVSYASSGAEISHKLLCGFLGMALLEEAIRWALLLLITRKNKNFNYLFDGVIYSAFLSLGFAAMENLRYALVNGWDQLFVRAVTTVPAHLFYGILMGVFYSLWHTWAKARELEREYLSAGRVETQKIKSPALLLACSLLVPLVVHGIAEFIALGTSTAMQVVYYVFIGILYIVCFILVFRLSSLDKADTLLAETIVREKHPETKE